MNQFKDIAGFTFIKIGEFYQNESPIDVKYRGETIQLFLSMRLLNADLKQLGESAYLLFSDDDLMYVGEYSFNLGNRWLRDKDYVWHHKDREILRDIKNDKIVSIWATVDPYMEINNGSVINISKSVESEVLKKYALPWNKRGKLKQNESWINKNCLKMSEILLRHGHASQETLPAS